jgi:mono/diheme cytochrome c family protein
MRVLRILIGGFIAATSVVAAIVAAGPQTPQIAEGKQKYDTYCAACHGAEGKGDGTLGKSLQKRPADLTQLAKKNQGQFPTETVAKLIDGRTGDEAHLKADMPVWGDVFSKSRTSTGPEDVKARIDALVKYLETIQDKGQY